MSGLTYDPARPCPKCGNPTITTDFKTDGFYGTGRLRRECGRCLYSWLELPLDYDCEQERNTRRAALSSSKDGKKLLERLFEAEASMRAKGRYPNRIAVAPDHPFAGLTVCGYPVIADETMDKGRGQFRQDDICVSGFTW